MKVIAINGSPNKNGNTSILIKHVLEELKTEGIETEIIQLGGTPVMGCKACMSCFKSKDRKCIQDKDIINLCIQKMTEADGIILGSPVYFANMTTELKGLIDRAGMVSLANGNLLKRKAGAAVVAVRRAGAVHVFNSINHLFTISQMIIPGSAYWNMGFGMGPGDVENDKEGLKTMSILGKNMAWLLKAINGK
jgi:multimeric flavodoxin WrbA